MSAMSIKSTTADEVAEQTTPQGSGENGKVPHLSLGERAARGKAERAEVPRACMASGRRRRLVAIQLSFWRSRPGHACRS